MAKHARQHIVSETWDAQGEAPGHWPRWLLYYGGPKLLLGWGSEEMTTGFCLEALARYQNEAPHA